MSEIARIVRNWVTGALIGQIAGTPAAAFLGGRLAMTSRTRFRMQRQRLSGHRPAPPVFVTGAIRTYPSSPWIPYETPGRRTNPVLMHLQERVLGGG